MNFMHIKTVKGRRYLYRQISRRKGKKVLSIMEYICALGAIAAIAAAAASPGSLVASVVTVRLTSGRYATRSRQTASCSQRRMRP